MWTTFLVITLGGVSVLARTKHQAKTPQMGWNSWNRYKNDFNQTMIAQTADLLVELGLRDAGYEYLIVDAGWQDWSRGLDGRQRANATRFPDGIAGLVDTAHNRGLKFGLYSDAGTYDCMFYPGSWGMEELDAESYAEWGVDYLKYDNCGGYQANTHSPQARFAAMGDALVKSERNILYSLCQWGDQFPWYWADQIAQSYRISGDIWASFSHDSPGCSCTTAYCLSTGYGGCSVLTIIKKMREISQFQKRGSWADMDMLEIGNAPFTEAEERTHMAFWAALKSPLIIGADLATLSQSTLAILKHKGIIQLSKDPLGQAVHFVSEGSVEGSLQIWAGRIQQGYVILIYNEGSTARDVEIPQSILWKITGRNSTWEVKDIWTNKALGTFKDDIRLEDLQVHDTAVLIIQEHDWWKSYLSL